MSTLTFLITPEQDGRRLSRLLRTDCRCSARLVKQLKYLPDGILLDGARAFLDQRVSSGQRLILTLPPDPPSDIVPRAAPLDILFEDEHLLVINKPAYVPVHPGPGHHTDSLGNFVTWHYLQQGVHHTYRPVNRLDRSTSGLLCVAKTGYIQELLKLQLHTQSFIRIYTAYCHCFMPLQQNFVNAPIGREKDSILQREIRSDGAPALTYFQVLANRADRTLLALKLATGRTHQIRVHMASIGHPLFGDFLYGQEEPEIIGRTALHAWHLSFLHPITGKKLEFTAPPPADLTALFPDYTYPDPATLQFGKDNPC